MTFTSFDIAEHLNTDEDIRTFLQEVADTGDASDLVHAVGIAARAKGKTEMANNAEAKEIASLRSQ